MKKLMIFSLVFLVACGVPSAAPTATPNELIDEKGISMRVVPAGEFRMGSEHGEEDESPVHRVYLDAFYMDIYEVTNVSFAACVKDGGCYPPQNKSSHTRPDYYGNPEFDNYPVIYMSGYKAEEYCKWRGGRLPTEAEWEKAARGANGFTYPWGDTTDGTKLNFCDRNCTLSSSDQDMDDGYADTAPVGSYESGTSPYGMYDMAGNVWEWVADSYDAAYYQTSPLSNPLGPDLDDHRVLRGGSWSDTIDFTRSTTRKSYFYNYYPDSIYSRFGFRCARSAKP